MFSNKSDDFPKSTACQLIQNKDISLSGWVKWCVFGGMKWYEVANLTSCLATNVWWLYPCNLISEWWFRWFNHGHQIGPPPSMPLGAALFDFSWLACDKQVVTFEPVHDLPNRSRSISRLRSYPEVEPFPSRNFRTAPPRRQIPDWAIVCMRGSLGGRTGVLRFVEKFCGCSLEAGFS